MTMYHYEYALCWLFIVCVFLVIFALFAVSYFLGPIKQDPEKLSAYECGFNPFEDARIVFDVKFYIVSILFIIFDLEVVFLFPWAISKGGGNLFSFWVLCCFLIILIVGFVYEWKKNALDWS